MKREQKYNSFQFSASREFKIKRKINALRTKVVYSNSPHLLAQSNQSINLLAHNPHEFAETLASLAGNPNHYGEIPVSMEASQNQFAGFKQLSVKNEVLNQLQVLIKVSSVLTRLSNFLLRSYLQKCFLYTKSITPNNSVRSIQIIPLYTCSRSIMSFSIMFLTIPFTIPEAIQSTHNLLRFFFFF